MQLSAPAKINLSFQIKGRRPDGFHEIETLMAPVSLADRITIERAGEQDGIRFTCDNPSLPADDDNLVVRAAKLFRRRTNVTTGITIALEKKIPHGAGLGGGSSDAAGTLLGLNELFAANLPEDELLKLAAELGSDVPFFVVRSPAVCRGRGEIVTPVGASMPPVAFSSLCCARTYQATEGYRIFLRTYARAKEWVRTAPAAEIAAAESSFFTGIDAGLLAAAIG